MKKSELRELVAKWKDLKRRSKNHDLFEKIRLIEHQYIMRLEGGLRTSWTEMVSMTCTDTPQS